MGRIKILSEKTVSQIAAGEVVERPSHLVKELVENAFDAGADEITVDFSQGGRFVILRDNGEGMAKEDLPLALTRHATAKIRHTEDLSRLTSYGFRGEALAAIASVSDLTLISSMKGQTGWRLQKSFGKQGQVSPAGDSPGTKIIVRSLFENVPARLKFMKSEGAENTAIKNTLKALALSRPPVGFRILQTGRLLFYWPPQKSLLGRVRQVLPIKGELYQTGSKKGAYSIQALVGAPHNTSKNRRASWFFVNGRWVDSPVLQAGLMSAYRGLLMHGEYPLAVIAVEGPGDEIDANVHPAKSQIRFKDSSFVFRLVEDPIRRLLEQAPWTKSITGPASSPKEKNLKFPQAGFHRTQFPLKQGLKREEHSLEALSRLKPPGAEEISQARNEALQRAGVGIQSQGGALQETGAEANPQARSESLARPGQKSEAVPQYGEKRPALSPTANTQGASWTSLQPLAQAHLTYIVCQSDKAVVFIDQHAAHERILYERLFHSWKKGGIEVQSQLIPFPLDLEEGQASALLESKQELKKLGLDLESLGPETLAVTAAPSILKEKALREALLLLARQKIETGAGFAFERAVSDLCASLACHSALRAGQALDLTEMRGLLTQMDEFPLSSFCPHGRPVFVEYPLSRLERDFCRTS